MALCLEHSVMYKALAERRLAGMKREQNSLMDQIDKIHGVRSGARYPPRPTPVVISGGITLNKVHVEQGAIAGVVNAGSNESRTHLALRRTRRSHDQSRQHRPAGSS